MLYFLGYILGVYLIGALMIKSKLFQREDSIIAALGWPLSIPIALIAFTIGGVTFILIEGFNYILPKE